MSRDLDPTAVAERLEHLRRVNPVPSVDARLQSDYAGVTAGTFAERASARLRELRALCELASYLHRRA